MVIARALPGEYRGTAKHIGKRPHMPKEIREIERFREVERRVLDLTLAEAKLPDLVFRKPFAHYLFLDFDRCFNPNLISLSNRICQLTNTSNYYFFLANPSPHAYYYRHFSRFGLFSFVADEDAERAWDDFDSTRVVAPRMLWLISRMSLSSCRSLPSGFFGVLAQTMSSYSARKRRSIPMRYHQDLVLHSSSRRRKKVS